MDRCLLIYLIIFISSFGLFVYLPLRGQYLYKRVADSYNFTKKTSCRNQTDNSDENDIVTAEVSRWNLLLNMVGMIPSSIVALLILSWGDRVGRKIVLAFPILGFLGGAVLFSLIIHYNWSLNMFFVSDFTAGLGGSYIAMMGQAAAYISDITTPEERGKRFVILEACMGIGGGIAGVSSGYWLEATGYLEPIICTCALQFVSILIIFLLPDSRKIRNQRNEKIFSPTCQQICEKNMKQDYDVKQSMEKKDCCYGSCEEIKPAQINSAGSYTFVDLLRSVWRVYSSDYSHCIECHGPVSEENRAIASNNIVKCVHNGKGFRGRRWRMWLYVISENIFMFAYCGVSDLQTIYFLSEPLCFSPLLIGLQQGLKFTLYGFSPILVFIYHRCCNLSNNMIALTGLVGLLVYSISLSLAQSPVLVFAGTGAIVVVNTTRPFILAQLSGMVLMSEQGAAMALANFGEIVALFLASVVFLTVYPATLSIYRGLIFDFGALLALVSILLITIIHVKDRRRSNRDYEEEEPLIT